MDEPSQIGHWKRVEELGSGSFGIVSLWVHQRTQEKLAIKKCRCTLTSRLTQKQRDRWILEVNHMSRISHENVVFSKRLPDELSSGLEKYNPSKLPIFAMEYCVLGNLRGLLNQPENSCGLKETSVCKFLGDISNGLSYLHMSGVTHRDLKPENIVMQLTSFNRPDEITYKIIDLGYAKELADATVSFVGTLHYLAPEMMRGKRYLSNVDCWSLGVMAYEAICGTRPFLPTSSPYEVLNHLINIPTNVISMQKTHTGDIASFCNLPVEMWIHPQLAHELTSWLRVVLRPDPKERGNSLQCLNFLKNIVTTKRITVFFSNSCEIRHYEINEDTLYITLQNTIRKDMSADNQSDLLFVPTKSTTSNRAADYYDPTNSDAMLFVFDTNPYAANDVATTCFPSLIDALLDDMKAPTSRHTCDRLLAQLLYFVNTQSKLVQIARNSVCYLCDYIKGRNNYLRCLVEDTTERLRSYCSEVEFYNLLEMSLVPNINPKAINQVKPVFLNYTINARALNNLREQIETFPQQYKKINNRYKYFETNCWKKFTEELANYNFDVLRNDIDEISKRVELHLGGNQKIGQLLNAKDIILIFTKTLDYKEKVMNCIHKFLRIAFHTSTEIQNLQNSVEPQSNELDNLKVTLRTIEVDKFKVMFQVTEQQDIVNARHERMMSSLLASSDLRSSTIGKTKAYVSKIWQTLFNIRWQIPIKLGIILFALVAFFAIIIIPLHGLLTRWFY